MKTLALWLYPLAGLVAALGGLNGASLFMFCLFCVCITVFLGIAQIILVVMHAIQESKSRHADDSHKRWIL